VAGASPATAADQIYFAATDNITNALVQKINAETVRIDMSAWYLSEHSISIALVNRFKAGIPVRLIGDRGAIFEIDVPTRNEFYWLANQGVPIRLRYNPTWYPEIDHWKTTIFAGQNLVAFGSANYTPFELAPVSSTNYKDELVLFSTDPSLVGAFKTKFDTYWNDTTPEPESKIYNPPFFKNWNEACATESACDYRTQYPSPAPMNINTARLEPDYALPPEMNWGQGSGFNNRLTQSINAESSAIDFVIYRLTVDNITQALLAKHAAGVPIRLIVEPGEYLNRKWPEFWITHANVDKLWAAGVPMKQRIHQGLTHMKTLITSSVATIASSNYSAAWQRDQNYFLPRSQKPVVYQAIKNRFQTMWNDAAGFAPFVPQPPDAATLAGPASGSSGLTTRPTLTWNIATFAVSYDVYLGTSAGALNLVGNVPAQLVNDPPPTYSWTPGSALQSGTAYFWKIVSRTNATAIDPSIKATSPTWSFTTGGTSTPPPSSLPSPWQSTDVGTVGQPGSATYSNGTFTVRGAGADIWGTADAFQYVQQSANGDVQIVARVSAPSNTSTFAKAGLMIRGSLAANSAHVILDMKPDGGVEFMGRSAAGESTTVYAGASGGATVWLKLARTGSTVTGYVSQTGSNWSTVGSTSTAIGTPALVGLIVCSHDTSQTTTATFDNVSVTAASAPPPPPPLSSPDVVIYASDVPSSALHGSWATASSASSPGGIKLATSDAGFAQTDAPLSSPTHYLNVTFNANAGTSYRIWMRLRALNDSKYNDAVWVQFSDALVSGSPAYQIGSSSGLLVNLATDGTATSLNAWGWQNTAYWLSQPTTVTFPTTGAHTLRIQVREDGVQVDQIVLSPFNYLIDAPGPATNDSHIVPKP
jgi:hypothetical protein